MSGQSPQVNSLRNAPALRRGRWRTEIQPRLRDFIRTIQHKRTSTGDGTRAPQIKASKATLDHSADWNKGGKSNGHLNGNGRSHPLSAGE